MLIVFLGGCEKSVDQSQLQFRTDQFGNSVAYELNSKTPFTGKSLGKDENGQISSESNYVDGLLDGLMTTWDAQGQKGIEMSFFKGKQDGLTTTWYSTGQLQQAYHAVGGEFEGVSEGCREDGSVEWIRCWYKAGYLST